MKYNNRASRVSFSLKRNSDDNNNNCLSPFKIAERGQSGYLTTEGSISPRRSSIRMSVMVPKFQKNPDEEKLYTLSNKQEKELEKKVQQKKNNIELKQLVKERSKFRAVLVQTRDNKSLELLSKKILNINDRISIIMKKINGEIPTTIAKKDYSFDKEDDININSDKIVFSSMKDDLKKINNYFKVKDIIFEGKIMDMKQNLDVEKKTSYFFQRTKRNSLYEPCTNLGRNNNTRNRNTLFQKGYRPFGFRTAKDQKSPTIIPTTFEDVYYQYEERQKEIEKEKEKEVGDKLNSDLRTFETESTFRCKTEINEIRSQSNKYKSKRHRRIATACIVQQNTNNLLTNAKIIKDSIKSTLNEEKKSDKSNHYKKLLFLLAVKMEKPKKKKKKKELEFNQERLYSEKLRKIPQSAKPFFRKVYNTILSEDKHLNKPNSLNIDSYEEKMLYLKRQKEFQKETYKNMYLMKEQDDKLNDDDEVFKDIKIFDNYGNIDSLEWLLKKKNALKVDSRSVGASNPYEKVLKIQYKNY